MRRTWVFQVNPTRFNIDGFFSTKPATTTFLVNRYRQEVEVGDQVFVWRSVGSGDQGAAGIIAEGEVIDPVSERLDQPNERPFWVNSNEAATPEFRLVLRLVRIAGQT
jgi:hypothetical protein